MTNLAWSVALAFIGIIGIFIAGKKSEWGWFIGLAAQFLWAIFAIATEQYGFILSALAYGWVYGYNWSTWRAKKRKAEANAA